MKFSIVREPLAMLDCRVFAVTKTQKKGEWICKSGRKHNVPKT